MQNANGARRRHLPDLPPAAFRTTTGDRPGDLKGHQPPPYPKCGGTGVRILIWLNPIFTLRPADMASANVSKLHCRHRSLSSPDHRFRRRLIATGPITSASRSIGRSVSPILPLPSLHRETAPRVTGRKPVLVTSGRPLTKRSPPNKLGLVLGGSAWEWDRGVGSN